jgi:hypothetical protein
MHFSPLPACVASDHAGPSRVEGGVRVDWCSRRDMNIRHPPLSRRLRDNPPDGHGSFGRCHRPGVTWNRSVRSRAARIGFIVKHQASRVNAVDDESQRMKGQSWFHHPPVLRAKSRRSLPSCKSCTFIIVGSANLVAITAEKITFKS